MNFLVAYYAMGWVAEGLNFVCLRDDLTLGRNPYWAMSIIAWPFMIPIYFYVWAKPHFPKIVRGDEFLWRKS